MTFEQLKKKKEILLRIMSDPMYKPMRLRDLMVLLDLPPERRPELLETLDALIEDGSIVLSKRGRYGKPEKKILEGVFLANAKGFGFVRTEDGQTDVFIPREAVDGCMNGDKVKVLVKPGQHGRNAEGEIIEITEHANREVVGFFRRVRNYGIVLPDNQKLTEDVYIPPEAMNGAVTGHKVVAEITRFPRYAGDQPAGRISEILGHVNDPGTDILSIARAYELPTEFPEEVLSEAAEIPETVSMEGQPFRKDLRDVLMVTIDGEDAKDLDDAVSLEQTESGWRLGVHIADVSEYVRERHPLDREALKRGTSVYLSDRVIPMLPHRLSNGICSLNAGEDRFALSCIMELDRHGNMTGHEITESLITVDRRMSYNEVSALIENREDKPELSEDIEAMLLSMAELSQVLRKKRAARGAVDFDFPETKLSLDAEGRPVSVTARERNDATKLIESFMLAANETVAEDYYWKQLPFLYRVHEVPDPEKMRALAAYTVRFGYTLRTKHGEVHPMEIRKLLEAISGTEAEKIISRITLRSMKQARYSEVEDMHFGLAAKYYTHFTSPIRRYPDLQIHRIIKEDLHGKLTEKRIEHYDAILNEVAKNTSTLERRAEDAERDSVKYKICEYMEYHVGEEYDGIISGVTRYGLFVELPDTVEGMIHISDLRGDYYEYYEESFELIGQVRGSRYRLGDRIRVRVKDADRLLRTVDFVPVEKKKED